jgi:hypothetical protein
MDAYIEKIPVHHTLSIDGTFDVQKRQFKSDARTRKHLPIDNKTYYTMIYGNGQIAYCSPCKGETIASAEVGFKKIFKRARDQGCHPPRIVWVDNCCGSRPGIQEIYRKNNFGTDYANANNLYLDKSNQQFPVVAQDTKHLINRLVEATNVNSDLYKNFSVAIHSVFTTHKDVLGRNMKVHKIHDRLKPSATILQTMDSVILGYKNHNNRILVDDEKAVSLFKADFDKVYENQKYHITHCVTDYPTNEHLVDDTDDKNLWYHEQRNGTFILVRGTNINESLHKRVNTIAPEKCGEKVANCVLKSHQFEWALKREFDDKSISGSISVYNYPFHERVMKLKEEIKEITPTTTIITPTPFSTTDYGYRYNSVTVPPTDYTRTLKQKNSTHNKTAYTYNKRDVVRENINKKRKRDSNDNDDDEPIEVIDVNRFEYDNVVCDPIVLELASKYRNHKGKANWKKIRDQFVRRFPNFTSINTRLLGSYHQAAQNRLNRTSPNIFSINTTNDDDGDDNNCDNDDNDDNDDNNDNGDGITSTNNNTGGPFNILHRWITNSSTNTSSNTSSNTTASTIDSTRIVTNSNNSSNNSASLLLTLHEAPPKSTFTEVECICLTFAVNKCNNVRKNWDTIAYLYHQEAQRRVNEDKNVKVYKREKKQLEQKYKDMMKKVN